MSFHVTVCSCFKGCVNLQTEVRRTETSHNRLIKGLKSQTEIKMEAATSSWLQTLKIASTLAGFTAPFLALSSAPRLNFNQLPEL